MSHVPRTPHAHRLHPEIRRYERGASGAKQLPLELIHHIVEPLAERGTSSGSVPPALEACSLVCRAWNHICRLHIFRTIVLGRSSAPQLSFLHFEAPHLSKYIVNLHMIFDDRTVAAAEDWFPDCLKRLEKLHVLRIDNFICIPPTLPALYTLGIMSLIATAHIEQLDLVYWDTLDMEDEPALLPMVSACSTTLQKLSIHICERDDPPAMPASTPSKPSAPLNIHLDTLRELKITAGFPRFRQADHIEYTNLECLTIKYRGDGPWRIPSYIPAGLCELVLEGTVTLVFLTSAIC